MTNTDIILNYAVAHNEFIVCKEFMLWLSENKPEKSLRSMDTTLRRMEAMGTLVRTKYGVFKLDGAKPIFIRY